jgi:hypothetical protein
MPGNYGTTPGNRVVIDKVAARNVVEDETIAF